MKNTDKYTRSFFPAPKPQMRWAEKTHIEKAPIWVSVDLRDGNQALPVPMTLDEKIDFFMMLLSVGFKEIEVGFPASNDTEYDFLRVLIERSLIPDDVTIQVLMQARSHIIRKTFESLKGAKRPIVHLYNSTSVAQRQQVFKKSKEEIINIALEGVREVKNCVNEFSQDVILEYSPESFTGTELEFALEICNAVIREWQPTSDNKIIINLPVTVELSLPHVYANQIEYMSDNLIDRENVILSVHTHNDRGSAVADSELAVLAGAQRVEGTLFGNGERTGNADLVTMALNLFAQGIEPGLDFSDINSIAERYENLTGMKINPRQPYSGALVFAAFSGSHQDAIAKGMRYRVDKPDMKWDVPYLMIDPKDIGRTYDSDVIRVNSQSGKGGIGYLMEQRFGIDMPPKMREDFGYAVKRVSDIRHKELTPDEIHRIFLHEYLNFFIPLDVTEVHFIQKKGIFAMVTVALDGQVHEFTASGNGRIDAVSNALKQNLGYEYNIVTYKEHAISEGSASKALAYVGIEGKDKQLYWGAGIHDDIMAASVNAMVSAINRMQAALGSSK